MTNSITTQPVVRLDYTASDKLRLTGKFAAQTQTRFVAVGSLPGFNDGQNWFPNRYGASATADYTLSDTAFIEGTWGWVQNQLTTLSVNSPANRFNVGLGELPMLYPDAGKIDPSYYAYEILEVSQSPMWVDGNVLLPPQFTWGNRITNTPPNISFPGALNVNRTHDVSLSMTKLMGRHTAKAGFYWNHAYKAQNLNTAGAVPFQGALNFGNDTLNPLDTGFGFANAALGVFSSYAQQSRFVEGGYIYNNIEWYVQDNWRVNSKLTLDYGVRFVHLQPTYDTRLQSSNFFPDQWTLAQAPLLYVAGMRGREPLHGHEQAGAGSENGTAARPVFGRRYRPARSSIRKSDQRDRAGWEGDLEIQLHVAVHRHRAAFRVRLRHKRPPEFHHSRRDRALPRSSGGRHDVFAGRQSPVLDGDDCSLRHAAGAELWPYNAGAAAAHIDLAV